MKNLKKIKQYYNRLHFLMHRENVYIPNGYKKNKKRKINNLSQPKVSILLPIYNHAEVANYAINSILKQTYSNIELIILDDGSTDNLQDILKKYYNNDKVKIYIQKNQKLPRALTHLHQLATGDFVTWTSADNIMHPKMIEVLVSNILRNPDAALVYGDVYVIDEKNRFFWGVCRDIDRDFKHPNIIRLLRNDKPLSIGSNNYINASFLYRKENSDALCGKYGDDIIGAEDYDFWLRLQKTGKLVHINNFKPLYYYRVHDNSMSHVLETKKAQEHRSRLEDLQKYEQNRIEWCNKRLNISLNVDLPEDKLNNIRETLKYLAVDVDVKNSSKNLIFTSTELNEQVYFKVEENNFILKNRNKEIVKIFSGLDITREAFWARNPFSHSYYQDDLIRIKNPIFGTHINSEKIKPILVEDMLKNNKNIVFVIVDEVLNKKIQELTGKYSNLYYYPNREYGTQYQTYSYFARVISFDETDIENNYKNLILAYAIGRKIAYKYNKGIAFFNKFPFTEAITTNLNFKKSDYLSTDDYLLMDKYVDMYSQRGALEKCIKLYNGFSQELFIQRPKYMINSIPVESAPKKVK